MVKILITTGSARPNSVGKGIIPLILDIIKAEGFDYEVIDLAQLNMPFFNSPYHPASPDFEIVDANVKIWSDAVRSADGVILITPEYNHTATPIQMNAIDWLFKEWNNKPVGLVGYGARSGASQSQATIREALGAVLGAVVVGKQANIYIGKDVDGDGAILNSEAVNGKILATIKMLADTMKEKNA